MDDNEGIRRLLSTAAESLSSDFEIIGEAENGEIGVAAAMWLQPDLVLLDISMPIMDGLSALPLIREAAPDASVVLLTGFYQNGFDVPADVMVVNKNSDLLFIFDKLKKVLRR